PDEPGAVGGVQHGAPGAAQHRRPRDHVAQDQPDQHGDQQQDGGDSVIAGRDQRRAQHVGRGDEGEEAEGTCGIPEVVHHVAARRDEAPHREHHEHDVEGDRDPEQDRREGGVSLELGPDRDDAGRHHAGEVAGCQPRRAETRLGGEHGGFGGHQLSATAGRRASATAYAIGPVTNREQTAMTRRGREWAIVGKLRITLRTAWLTAPATTPASRKTLQLSPRRTATPTAAAPPTMSAIGTNHGRAAGQWPRASLTALAAAPATVAATSAAPCAVCASGTSSTPHVSSPRAKATELTDSTMRGRPSTRRSWCTNAAMRDSANAPGTQASQGRSTSSPALRTRASEPARRTTAVPRGAGSASIPAHPQATIAPPIHRATASTEGPAIAVRATTRAPQVTRPATSTAGGTSDLRRFGTGDMVPSAVGVHHALTGESPPVGAHKGTGG